jgi:hypothetical protein
LTSALFQIFFAVPHSSFRLREKAGVTIRAIHAQTFEYIFVPRPAFRSRPIGKRFVFAVLPRFGGMANHIYPSTNELSFCTPNIQLVCQSKIEVVSGDAVKKH